jgi:hypothetical protein
LLRSAHDDCYVGGVEWLVRIQRSKADYQSVGNPPVASAQLRRWSNLAPEAIGSEAANLSGQIAIVCPV